MNGRQKYLGGLLAGVVLGAGLAALAGPVLDTPEEWTAGDQGWDVQSIVGANVSVANSGTADPYLRITFDAQGEGNPGSAEIFADSGASSGNFVGGYYGDVLAARFRFYADETLPSSAAGSLALYFYNATSGRTWQYNLSNPAAVQTWTWYEVSFSSVGASAWHTAAPGYTEAEFISDLGAVNWIGLYISRFGTTAAEHYGLDDFELTIPEPGTIWVLLAAMVPMAVTFRGRLAEVLRKVRARFLRA